jgi:hypothetical protein
MVRLTSQEIIATGIWVWWFTPVIPATWESEVGRSQSEASLDKVDLRPNLKSKLKAKGMRAWLSTRALAWFVTHRSQEERAQDATHR